MCRLAVNPPAGQPMSVPVSSSSRHVLVPSQVRVRAGQSSVAFKVSVSGLAPEERADIIAGAGPEAVKDSIQIQRADEPALTIEGETAVKLGSPVRLRASAASTNGFPVTLRVLSAPPESTFDSLTGDFTWTPKSSELGDRTVVFQALDTFGIASSVSTALHAGTGAPELISLAGACTPGSAAALQGHFLSAAGEPGQLLINGTPAQAIQASAKRIDFICPQQAPESAIELAVRTVSGTSNVLRTKMQASSPTIVTTDDVSGEALALHAGSSEIAALAAPNRDNMPAVEGEAVSIFATGIRCEAAYSGAVDVEVGGVATPVASISPAAGRPGACALTFGTPMGITGENLSLRLRVRQDDGTIVGSAPATLTVEQK